MITLFIGLFSFTSSFSQIQSAQSGPWTTPSTWTGGVVPTSANNVVIRNGHDITVSTSVAAASLTIANSTDVNPTTLTVSGELAVTNNITINNLGNTNVQAIFDGTGRITASSLTVGGTTNPTGTVYTAFASRVAELTLSGNLNVTSRVNGGGTNFNNAYFIFDAGITTVTGTVTLTSPHASNVTNLWGNGGGTETGTLVLLASGNPISTSGAVNVDFNGTSATVEYGASAAQTVYSPTTSYRNLTLSGSGAKTLSGFTINNTLRIEEQATTTGTVPNYSVSASIDYRGSIGQVTGVEFPAAFGGSGGIRINNPSGVTLGANRNIGGNPLYIGDAVSNSVFNDGGRTLTATGTLNLTSGTFNIGSATSGTSFPAFGTRNIGVGTTVAYIADLPQTVASAPGYSNLSLSGSGLKTAGGALNVGNNLNNTATLDMLAFTLTVTNTIGNAGGIIRFSGATNGLAIPTGRIEYTGGAQAVAGGTYNVLHITAAGAKTAGSGITVTDLDNGGVSNAAAILDMGSHSLSVLSSIDNTNGTISFSGASNGVAISSGTVNYYGASQTVDAGTYNNLTINQSSGDAMLAGNATVNGVLTLSAGSLNVAENALTISQTGSLAAVPFSTSRMIIATGGGQLRKTFNSAAAFTFPIGDNTGARDYTPVIVTPVAAPGVPSYIGISAVDAKHPSNFSGTYFLSRYWELTHNNASAWSVSVNATFASSGDVSLAPNSEISPAHFNGAFTAWTKSGSTLGVTSFTINPVTLAAGQLTTISGITADPPTVSIAPSSNPICIGSSVTLSATPVGDSPFIYSWTGNGLNSATAQNPVATPVGAGPFQYDVFVRDANGITSATESVSISHHPQPATPTIGAIPSNAVCDGANPDVTLTSSAAPNGGAYLWYKGGVSTGIITQSIVLNDPAASGSYTVVVTDGTTGCASAPSVATVVTISAPPTIDAGSDEEICQGQIFDFADQSVLASGTNYTGLSWSGGAGNLTNSNTLTPVYVPAPGETGTITFTLAATGSVSCPPALATMDLVITPPPVVNAGPATAQICAGGIYTIAGASITGVVTDGVWSRSGTGSFDGVGNTFSTVTTYTPSAADILAGSVTLTLTSNDPTGDCTPVQDELILTISAPIDKAVSAPFGTAICASDMVAIRITNSEPGVNYVVRDASNVPVSDVFAGTGNNLDILTDPISADVTLNVFAENPVTLCSRTLSATVGITVTAPPATPVISPAGPVVQCQGDGNIVLTTAGGSSYQWYKDGALLPGQVNATLTITDAVANSGSYRVEAYSAAPACPSALSAAVAVTINALPNDLAVTAQTSTTICANGTVTLRIASSQAGVNYQIFEGATPRSAVVPGTGGNLDITTSALASSATLSVVAINGATSCDITLSATVGITVTAPPATPVISPAGPVVQCQGDGNIVLTTAGGSSYQWYKDGALLPGQVNATLTITDAVANSGSYRVEAYSAAPACPSALSAAVAVTINALPNDLAVTAQTSTDVCENGSITVRIANSQAGINYEIFDQALVSQSAVVAGTGANLDIVTAALPLGTTTLTVQATNPVTGCTITLSAAVAGVTVTAPPAQPVVSNVGSLVQCQGSVSLTLNSDGLGATHQWYKDNVLIPLATGSSYTVPDAVSSTGTYTVTTSTAGPAVCTSLMSAGISVTINATPDASLAVALSATPICEFTTASLTITGSELGVNYEVLDQASNVVSALFEGNGGILNITTNPLTNTVTNLRIRARYGLSTCTAILADNENITVTILPVGTTVAISSICSDIPTAYGLAVPNATSYAVSINANGLTQSAGAGTPNIISDDAWTNLTASTVNVVYTVIPSNGSCAGNSFTVTVPVRPEPRGANASVAICSEDAVGYDLQASNVDVLGNALPAGFSWAAIANGNVTGEGSGTSNVITNVLTNTTGVDQIVTYTVTPTGTVSACAGDVFTVQVTVKPIPVVNDITLTTCSDVALGAGAFLNTVGGSVSASSYRINAIATSGLTASAGLPANGAITADALTDDAWTNTSGGTLQVVYNITPLSAAGCEGNAFTVTVDVLSETPANANVNATAVCSDVNVNYTLSVAGASTFTISTNNNGLVQSLGTVSAGSGKLADELEDDRWTNNSSSTVNVIYTVTPVTSAGCSGASFTVTVPISPEPVGVPLTITTCSDAALGTAATLTTASSSIGAASFNINTITMNGLSASAGAPATGAATATDLTNDAWTNNTGGTVQVIYNVTPISAAGCNGDPFDVVVNVAPETGTTSNVVTTAVCSDLPVNYVLGVTGATTYTISTNSNGLIQSGGSVSAGAGKLASELSDDQWTNTTLNTVNVIYTITPSNGGCNGDIFTVTVPIGAEPRGANATKAICSNNSVNYDLQVDNIDLLGNDLPSNFTWVAADNANITGESLTNQTTGVINNVLVNTTAVDQVVVYTVTPVGSATTCTGDSFTVSVTVKPEPVSNSFTITTCSDTPLGTAATLTPIAGSVSAASYTINSITTTLAASAGAPATGSVNASNLINDAWTNTTAGMVTVVYNITPVSSAGCNGVPFDVTVQVNPEPVITSNIVAAAVCSDVATNVNLTVSGATTYTISTNSNGLVQSAGTVSAGSGKLGAELADDRWTNITLNTVNVVYTITPFNGTCAGDVFTVTVPIGAEPRGANATKAICSNSSVNYDLQVDNIDLLGNDLPSNFMWVAASNANVTGETLTNQTTGTLNDVLVNTTAVDQVVVYTVTPVGSVTACTGDVFTVSVTVRPEPVVSASLNTTVCSDASIGVTLATNGTSVAASTYTLVSVVADAGLSAHGTNATLGAGKNSMAIFNDKFTNSTTGNLQVLYTVTPVSSAGCSGAQQVITITVRPEPVITATLDRTTCSDVAGGLMLSTTGSVAAASYTINSITVASGLTPASGNVTMGSGYGANAIAADVFTNATSTSLTVVYNVTPVSSLGCLGNSINITVTVQPEPSANNSLQNSVCSDVAFSFNPQSNIINAQTSNFTWSAVYQTGLTGGAATGTGAVAGTLTNLTSGTLNAVYTVTPVSQSGTCTGNPFTITVPIRPEPVGVADASTVCSDNAVNYNLINNVAISGNNVGSTFTWIAADNTSVTGESLTSQSNVRITNVINNVTNTPQVVTYSVTPTSVSGCAGNPFAITVTVNPEPVGVSVPHVICSDLSVAYDLQSNVNTSGNNLSAIFNWSATANAVVTGEGTLVKSASVIDDILRNPSNNIESVVYTVNPTAQSTGCAGNTFTINVSVNPRAKISAGRDLELCANFPGIALEGSINYAPNGIVWSGGQGSYSSVNNPTATYSFANPAEINTTVTLTMTATDPDGAGPCPTESDQMALTINRLPIVVFTGLPSGSPPQMAENNLPITLTGNQTGGGFTIMPVTSNIGSTISNPGDVDKVLFDPDAAELGSNFITYTYTDANGCVNSNTREVVINPITNVDFTIQGATLNADGQYEICANLSRVKLIGFPPASSGFGPETQFSSIPAYAGGPVAPIILEAGEYYIQTDNLVSDTYRIRYDYKNAFDAITFKLRDVRIFASPVAQLTSANNCIASDVIFSDLSTINPTPFPTNIVSWQWDFDDNSTSALQNPSKRYSEPDTYNVRLRVGTAQGCFDTSDVFPVRVGAVPIPDFKWSAICNSEFTKFEDTSVNPGNVSTITDYTWDFGDGNILIGQTAQPVPAGQHSGTTTGVYERPDHQYAAFDTYDVTLTVQTNDGCTNTITKEVFILPYSTVKLDANNSYLEGFENSNGGWIAEAGMATNLANVKSDTSWIWGLPMGQHITSGANNSQNAWWTGKNTTGDGVTYFAYENSSVNGPCFDLTKLERPMVSLDYFADMDVFDGAVLQYSIDGGNNWRIVGNESPTLEEGINWFNGRSLPSNPGKQTLGQYGWTGNQDQSQGTWKTARFNLDMVPVAQRKQVRLRVAFASNDGNPEGDYDGFAFDNFFVGNKKRTVLVEHFTNATSQNANNASAYVDQLFDNQVNWHALPDFVKLQYHMSVPAFDQLNRENPGDPGARAFFYNVTSPPHTLMDGLIGNYYNKVLNGDHAQIDRVELDRRALEDPEFMVDTVGFQPAAIDVLRAQVTFSYAAPVAHTTPVIFQVALMESAVTIGGVLHRNVLRKLLLQSEGFTVNRTWNAGDLQSIDIDYAIDVPISDGNNLYVVAFVQDKNTRKILQARVLKAPVKQGITPVGIEDDPATAEIRNIHVYPNPASQRINFYLENELSNDYGWHIVDQRGVTVQQGELNRNLLAPQEVSISELANGIYFVRFTRAGKTITYRKIAVLNSN
ncbi:MAG TPA: PKD-like domain-containing protein [Chryseosolibacter sp.]